MPVTPLCNFNNNNLFNLSSFTLSGDDYRLTLGYDGVASFIYNYISSALLNRFFLTISKYFPTFCMCVLFVIFIIFLHATSLFMFSHLSLINFSLQCFVSLHSNKICSTSFPKHNGHLPLSAFLLTLLVAISLLLATLFRSFLFLNSILHVTFCPKKTSISVQLRFVAMPFRYLIRCLRHNRADYGVSLGLNNQTNYIKELTHATLCRRTGYCSGYTLRLVLKVPVCFPACVLSWFYQSLQTNADVVQIRP